MVSDPQGGRQRFQPAEALPVSIPMAGKLAALLARGGARPFTGVLRGISADIDSSQISLRIRQNSVFK
jgi:hypothetical protein